MKLIKHKLSRQEIIYIAILAGIWGAVEITLGTTLQIAKVPMRGMILTFLSAIILIVSRRLVDFRGALILIGAICAGFKVASMGGFVLTPVIAIIAQSVLAEIVFAVLKYSLFSSIFAGVAVMFYTIVHMIGAHLLFFGFEIVKIYDGIYRELHKLLPTPIENFYVFAFVLIIIYFVIGAIAGIIGFRIAEKTAIRIKSDIKTNQ